MQHVPGSSPSSPTSPNYSNQQPGGGYDMERQQPAHGSPNFGSGPANQSAPPRERLRSVPLIVASYNVRVEYVRRPSPALPPRLRLRPSHPCPILAGAYYLPNFWANLPHHIQRLLRLLLLLLLASRSPPFATATLDQLS
jgi:hypothetical protein